MKKVLVALLVVGFAAVAASAQEGRYIAHVQTDRAMRKITEKAAAEKAAAQKHQQVLQSVEKAHEALITAGLREASLDNVIEDMVLRLEELKGALKELSAINATEGAIAKKMVYHNYYVKVENKEYTIGDIEAKARQLFPYLVIE